jgi:hypothetical protein
MGKPLIMQMSPLLGGLLLFAPFLFVRARNYQAWKAGTENPEIKKTFWNFYLHKEDFFTGITAKVVVIQILWALFMFTPIF